MKIKYVKRFLCILLVASLLCGCGRSHIKSSYIKEGFDLLVGLGEGLVKGLVNAWTSDGEDDDYVDVDLMEGDEKLTKQADQVYEALKEGDRESIKKMFSPYTAEKYDLDKEIKKLFKKIDGNVVSVQKAEGWTGGYQHDAEKGYLYVRSEESLRNIKTDTGKTYCMKLYGYYSNSQSEDKVGINLLYVWEEEKLNTDHEVYEIGDSV